jgi:hypothetical protein
MMGAGPMVDGYTLPTGYMMPTGMPQGPAYQGYVPMAPMMGQGSLMPPAGMPAAGAAMSTATNVNVPGQHRLTTYDGVPGTLGLTYQLPSKRANWDKHPRVGLLEITVSDDTFRSLGDGEEIKITVEDEAGHFEELDGYFGDDDKWHFESETLYPGIPHIYDVKLEVVRMVKKKERKGDKLIEWEVGKAVRDLGLRRLRLIPGRTVYLSYP